MMVAVDLLQKIILAYNLFLVWWSASVKLCLWLVLTEAFFKNKRSSGMSINCSMGGISERECEAFLQVELFFLRNNEYTLYI